MPCGTRSCGMHLQNIAFRYFPTIDRMSLGCLQFEIRLQVFIEAAVDVGQHAWHWSVQPSTAVLARPYAVPKLWLGAIQFKHVAAEHWAAGATAFPDVPKHDGAAVLVADGDHSNFPRDCIPIVQIESMCFMASP
jgi:hypothetical protein